MTYSIVRNNCNVIQIITELFNLSIVRRDGLWDRGSFFRVFVFWGEELDDRIIGCTVSVALILG